MDPGFDGNRNRIFFFSRVGSGGVSGVENVVLKIFLISELKIVYVSGLKIQIFFSSFGATYFLKNFQRVKSKLWQSLFKLRRLNYSQGAVNDTPKSKGFQ